MTKKQVLLVFVLLILVQISYIAAITGSIGNARMVLRAEVGDMIEKSILVKNVNNISVEVSMSVAGDLEDYITLDEESFVLEPGEEKKAYFTIDVKKGGTSETKINVRFNPLDEGNGVGLSSTIIVIAEGEDDGSIIPDLFGNNDDTDNEDDSTDDNGGVSVSSKNKADDSNGLDISPIFIIFSVFTIILFVIFIVLLVLSRQIFSQKSGNKGGKKVNPKKAGKKHG